MTDIKVIKEMRCPMCNKKILCEIYICKNGILKGYKVANIWQHKVCEELFYQKLNIIDKLYK